MNELEKKYKEVLEERLEINSADIDMKKSFPYDYDIDSLDIVGIMMQLEREFMVTLDKENVGKIAKVEDLYNLLVNTIETNSSSGGLN
ncbi:acyl carrier protein [Clostridium beijerinckii]|uniref:Acyl carrier protein n=1 Tax=Clostridium beijerinckii TaxID=1520 RepID=A0A1S8SK00_CLOBE|nr:acyl carrier protein [Clostridium beijerinckii]NRY61555.1 acyl carrier protein [Clostridium beijerinckii]OOM65850.1 acyl carrier protein [Clostridium beijerinckii]